MSSVYSFMKLFHHKKKITDLERGTLSAPIYVRLKPTNKCNHNCWYCCYRSEKLFLSERFKIGDMIPKSKMREITSDFVNMGVKAVTFSGGGEPLIYPYINETVERLLVGGIKVACLTNGSFLKGDTGKLLADGATWVRISMDAADGDTYAGVRGVRRNEFSKVLKNIEDFAIKKRTECELGINLIVTIENYKDIYSFTKRMKEKGVNHVKVSECVVSTNGLQNNEYHKNYFNSVKEQIKKASEELSSNSFVVIDKFHDFDDKFQKRYKSCPHLHFQTIVAADQCVYTCHDKAYTDSGLLGSLKKTSFKELWCSEMMKKRISTLDPSMECEHHCAVHGKNQILLDYLEVDPFHKDFV